MIQIHSAGHDIAHWCQLNQKRAVRNRVYTGKTHLRGTEGGALLIAFSRRAWERDNW